MGRTDWRVYQFGNGAAEGDANMSDLLGGKGANLAEMSRLACRYRPDLPCRRMCAIISTKMTGSCQIHCARRKCGAEEMGARWASPLVTWMPRCLCQCARLACLNARYDGHSIEYWPER